MNPDKSDLEKRVEQLETRLAKTNKLVEELTERVAELEDLVEPGPPRVVGKLSDRVSRSLDRRPGKDTPPPSGRRID